MDEVVRPFRFRVFMPAWSPWTAPRSIGPAPPCRSVSPIPCRGVAEIRQLRYFAAVAERGNVSRAALDLHLSQSALSEALRKLKLELELGVQLLERSARGVAPTPAGTALLPEARAAIARFDAALDTARAAARGQSGRLR